MKKRIYRSIAVNHSKSAKSGQRIEFQLRAPLPLFWSAHANRLCVGREKRPYRINFKIDKNGFMDEKNVLWKWVVLDLKKNESLQDRVKKGSFHIKVSYYLFTVISSYAKI